MLVDDSLIFDNNVFEINEDPIITTIDTEIAKITTIDNLFNKVLDNIDEELKTVLIEEITENLFIFIIHSHKFLKTHSQWGVLIEKLNRCSKLKAKDHKSISSRIVFKYMDIQDALKKMR